jgi:hypothetical protein
MASAMRNAAIVLAAMTALSSASINRGLAAVASATPVPVPGDELQSDGVVVRRANGFNQLMGPKRVIDLAPERDFDLPEHAAPPTEHFEGTLSWRPAPAGLFRMVFEIPELTKGGHKERLNQLPPLRMPFVQNGSFLIPANAGLVITGSASWNLIIGTGRAWSEKADHGYTRASVPFALVWRNDGCVHNGTFTFLFSKNAKPNVSNIAYQITGEGCAYLQFDMGGQVAASYEPGRVPEGAALAAAEAAEVSARMPMRSFSDLSRDFPKSGFDPKAFLAEFEHPENVAAYGIVFRGIHYTSGCATRGTAHGLGTYPYCAQMRYPSYSTAKSVFAGLALMRLAQRYGRELYDRPMKDDLPQLLSADKADWSAVTYGHSNDMATGNYLSSEEEADEDSSLMNRFLDLEAFDELIAKAPRLFPHRAAPGTTFVYHSSDTFIQTQAMNAFLKRHEGRTADLFAMMWAEVYRPLHMSRGFQATMRTDNRANGAPWGYAGLFWSIDDLAKLAAFLSVGDGRIDGQQIIDPKRLQEALFRTPQSGLQVSDWEQHPKVKNSYVYNHNFWGKRVGPEEFPSIRCRFIVPIMSGYGGVTVMFLPNGAAYYVLADGNEYLHHAPIEQIGRLAPYCPGSQMAPDGR